MIERYVVTLSEHGRAQRVEVELSDGSRHLLPRVVKAHVDLYDADGGEVLTLVIPARCVTWVVE